MEQRTIHEDHSSHAHHHLLDKATDVLKQDHRIIERVLAVLERLAQNPREASLEDWQKAIDFIRGFADRCHHLKEEKILFPALERHGIPREGGPIGMMLVEHEEGRAYVREMVEALAHEGGDSEVRRTILGQNARAYLRLLREHIRKEDEVLFQMADEALSPEEQKELAQEFEKHETEEIGAGVHEKYLKIAEELERHSDG
jgi:hemerythrin-like domain-containing protein